MTTNTPEKKSTTEDKSKPPPPLGTHLAILGVALVLGVALDLQSSAYTRSPSTGSFAVATAACIA